MNVCRICLMTKPEKDISLLKIEHTSSIDILMFCLDIKVVQDSGVSTKLCLKCYKKVIAFHKFKSLALKSDAYLKSLQTNTEVKNEVYIEDESDIKVEQQSLCSDDLDNTDVKDECIIDADSQEYQSDNELLSVIKRIKYEYVDETKENAPVKKKKGRPKTVKLKRIKEEKPNQVCEECGMTVKNLKEHLYIHLPKEARKRIKCHVCDKIFSSHSARYKHNQRKHLGIKQHCKICNKFVVSIKQHTLVMHESDSLPFGCVSCGRRFISQSRLDMHMTVHTKDRPYQCDQCEKTFRSKLTMLMHKRQVHDQEKSHVCEFCSKSFFKKYHLQIHLRSHTKEKPYKCPECSKYFSTTTILKNHRLIHSDVKMFACTQCDMTFVRPGYLSAHMISHTKVKRHPCQYCGLKFGRSDHRKRHEHTAHERHLVNT